MNEDFGFDFNDENLIDEIDFRDEEYPAGNWDEDIDEGDYYDNADDFNLGHEFDEGSDRDNWEDEQVFQDREWE